MSYLFAASSFYGEEGHSNFVNVMFDLFLTGSETTSTTLNFTLLYLLHFPRSCEIVFGKICRLYCLLQIFRRRIAKRLRKDIDEVVGRERLPSLDDREKVGDDY